jgi:hypothetical protein
MFILSNLSAGMKQTHPVRHASVQFSASDPQDLQLLKLKQLIARADNGILPERQSTLQTLAKNLLNLKKDLIPKGIEFLKLLGKMPTSEEQWKSQLTRIKTKLTQENQLDVSQVLKTPLTGPKELIQTWLNEFMTFIGTTSYGKEHPLECLQYRMQYPHPQVTPDRQSALAQISNHLSQANYDEDELSGLTQNLMAIAQLPIPQPDWNNMIKDLINQDAEETSPLKKLLKQNELEDLLPESLIEPLITDVVTLTDPDQVNEILSELNQSIDKELNASNITININPYIEKPNEDLTKISSIGTYKNNSDQLRKLAVLLNYCDDGTALERTMAFTLHIPLKGGKNSSLTITYGGRTDYQTGGKYLTAYSQLHVIFEHQGEKKSITLESKEPSSSNTGNDELDAFHDTFFNFDESILPDIQDDDLIEELLGKSKKRVSPKYTLNTDNAGLIQFRNEESSPSVTLLDPLSTKGR